MNCALRSAAVLFGALFSAPAMATGMFECAPTDRSTWLSQDEVTEKLISDGWQVRRMKEDGGCWEVYGTTPDGKRVEVYLHPVSGDVLLINQRGTVIYRK